MRMVLGPFMDGRSGYVFAVNPSGARYDGMINPGGETDNPEWDGIWEAATVQRADGLERRDLDSVSDAQLQARPARVALQRPAPDSGPARNRSLGVGGAAVPGDADEPRRAADQICRDSTSGVGLSVRPAVTTGGGVPAPAADVDGEFQPSLDVTQRLGANVLASATVNTDFAETEVDTRRTNLTRFPLFFPEKRTFFLEGDDIFAFGLGLEPGRAPVLQPPHWPGRRAPKCRSSPAARSTGASATPTSAALVVGTNDRAGVVRRRGGHGCRPRQAEPVARVVGRRHRHRWRSAGTAPGSWLAGGDFTYATSRFRGDKNFLVGVWGLATGRARLGGDRQRLRLQDGLPERQVGHRADLQAHRARLRSVARLRAAAAPCSCSTLGIDNRTRIAQRAVSAAGPRVPAVRGDRSGRASGRATGCSSRRSTGASAAAIASSSTPNPIGERLVAPFEVSDGVVIAAGSYHWKRYRLEVGTAQKRRLYTQVTWWFGGFYDGTIDQVVVDRRLESQRRS